MSMTLLRSTALAAGLAAAVALSACTNRGGPTTAPPTASTAPTLLFSYEALIFEPLGLDETKARYPERAAFIEQVKETELPQILALLKIPADQVETEVTPGGYQLQTSASLQSAFEADARTADLFASSVGYVFRQWSVLVTDFTPEGQGNTGFAVVTFEEHPPSGAEAQAFFEHAAKLNEGLNGGYTAFGRDLFFLNVADSSGKPYSGIDDARFVADLTRAAESFMQTPVSVTRSGRVDARFVENDWDEAATGQDYARTLGPDLITKLTRLRAAHEQALRQAAVEYGWT